MIWFTSYKWNNWISYCEYLNQDKNEYYNQYKTKIEDNKSSVETGKKTLLSKDKDAEKTQIEHQNKQTKN